MHTYIHVVVAFTKSIATRQSNLFREHNHGHLDSGFTKEFSTKEGARPPHKDRSRRSTPSRRVVDVAGELQSSKGPVHQALLVGSTKNHSTKAQSLALTHSIANLALYTLEASAKPKDMINEHLGRLGEFPGCV